MSDDQMKHKSYKVILLNLIIVIVNKHGTLLKTNTNLWQIMTKWTWPFYKTIHNARDEKNVIWRMSASVLLEAGYANKQKTHMQVN